MVTRTHVDGWNPDLDGCPWCGGFKRFIGGWKHEVYCPFHDHPIKMRVKKAPPQIIDPWLCVSKSERRHLWKEYLEGNGNGYQTAR